MKTLPPFPTNRTFNNNARHLKLRSSFQASCGSALSAIVLLHEGPTDLDGSSNQPHGYLGHFLFSPRNLGKIDSHFDEHIFQMGWNSTTKQLWWGWSYFQVNLPRNFGGNSQMQWILGNNDILKLTNCHQKIDGWNTIVSFLGKRPIFRGGHVSFRACICKQLQVNKSHQKPWMIG